MVSWHAGFHLPARILQVLLFRNYQPLVRVLLESPFPSSYWSNPKISAALYEVEHHLLVVASQTNNALRIGFGQFLYEVYTAGRIWPTIDQVSQKDEGVIRLVTRNHFQQLL